MLQVLLISALLMIMLISFQQHARTQLKIAEKVQRHADLQLQLQSTEARLMFILSTHEWAELAKASGKFPGFNFHGQPFQLDNAVVTIQDQSGLLSANSPDRNAYAVLTKHLFGDAQLGIRLADELQDWRDADNQTAEFGAEQAEYGDKPVRNYGLQTLDELLYLKSMTPERYRLLKPYFSVFRQDSNLMNMPAALVPARLPAVAAEQLLQSRAAGQLDQSVLWALGIDVTDEANILRFGRMLQLTFTVENADVKLTRSFIMTFDPSKPVPFELLEYRMRDTEMEQIDVPS